MAEQWNFVTSSFVDDQQALTTQSRLRQLRRTGSIQSLPAQSLLRKRDSTAITFSLSTKRPVVGRGCMPSKIVRGRNVSYAGTGIARPVQLDVVRNEEPQPEDGNEGGDGGDAGDGNDGADDAGEDGRGDGGATAGLQPDDDDNAWYSAEEEEEWDINDESLWSNNQGNASADTAEPGGLGQDVSVAGASDGLEQWDAREYTNACCCYGGSIPKDVNGWGYTLLVFTKWAAAIAIGHSRL